MSKSENDNTRRHILYPKHQLEDFGWLHHEDSFFLLLTPEVASKFLNEQTDELTIKEKSRDVPVFKGCFERIACGNDNPSHAECYSIIAQDELGWEVYDSCLYKDDTELLAAVRENGAWPLNQRDVQYIVDRAKPSSIYQNPFLGFDNPDKQYAPQEWLVADMFPARSLNAIVGVSDSFKSFLAIHLACCIATGTPFFREKCATGSRFVSSPRGW